jgi:hypothetical protein
MKTKIKNYWVFIALILVLNILIFSVFSKKLEGLVDNYTIDIESGSGN